MNDTEWFTKYKPIPAPENKGGFLVDDVDYLFKNTQGKSLRHTWSLVKASEFQEGTRIVAGRDLLNNLGFFITEEPWSSIYEEYEVE